MEKKSILLVEDDATVRDVIKATLERKYYVYEASKYSEAIEQLKIKNPIDLAIIDYNLPDRDGFEVLKAIKEVKPALPVIIITAFSTKTLIIRALREGVTDYIEKPLHIKYLMRKVSEILREEKDKGDTNSAENRDEFIMDGIAEYIETNYKEDLTRNKLASMTGMNKYKFSRDFKKRFGQNFRSYLNRIRIKNAAELLKDTHLNITDIALSVGYGSIIHFERIFRNVYGIPPRKYRREVFIKL